MANTDRKTTIAFWVLTLLVLLPTAGSGVAEVFTSGPEQTIKAMQVLGYPLYLMKILGTAKILGAMAILTGHSKMLKEWAFAGFAINFIGATASHLLAGDSAKAPMPFVFFILLMGAYYFSKKRETV